MDKKVSRYELISQIGEGGLSIVYKAYDPLLKRSLAIKVLKTSDLELLRRFSQEAEFLAMIDDDCICQIYDFGYEEGRPYIAMQLIEGTSLQNIVFELTIEHKLKIVRQIAITLAKVHRRGLVHRDLKPSNILVEKTSCGEYKPYLIDFGLARNLASNGLTLEGTVIGTLGYIPPEQALGNLDKVDQRSDIFGLGAVLYFLFTGQPPFPATNLFQLQSMIKKGVPRLKKMILLCLKK